VSLESLESAVPAGDLVLLDSSAVIAYLTGGEAVSLGSATIIDRWLRSGRNQAIVSAVSVMETLVRALGRTPPEDEAILTFFAQWPNLTVAAVDTRVARAAAHVRARRGFSPPDALILGTAIAAGGSAGIRVVTGDERWKTRSDALPPGVSVVYLHDHLPFA
jgi:predicted nucleic acid-binding protein